MSCSMYTCQEYLSGTAILVPAVYRQGEITLAGRRRRIALVDWNAYGRFDVRVGFAPDGKGAEDFLAHYGTEILLDQEMPITRQLGYAYLSEHRQFLGKVNALGGDFYEIKVTPGGDELTCTPVEVPLGKITAPCTPCNLWLINEQGFLALNLPNDAPVEIPAGVWRLMCCTVEHAEEKTSATEQEQTSNRPPSDNVVPQSAKESPVIRFVTASGGNACEPITVIAGQTTTLKLGPPYTPTLTVETKDKVAMLDLEFRGIGHEKVTSLGGPAPPKPAFTITDPRGKMVEQGCFEYG